MSSAPDIANNLPDPFGLFPAANGPYVPYSKVTHIPSQQALTGTVIALTPGQLVAPIYVSNGGVATDLTFPSPALALTAFGGNVQPGDIFQIPVTNLGSAALTITPYSGSVTGSTTIVGNSQGFVGINFTNVNSGSEAYVLSNVA
jgi:hypothetical protein